MKSKILVGIQFGMILLMLLPLGTQTVYTNLGALFIILGLAVGGAALLKNRLGNFNIVPDKKLINILPAFLTMLILVSIVLFLIPDKVISEYLGNNNKFIGIVLASFFGSATLMPGFIAFPLCGILLKKGVSYMVLAAFTTTLMMVGILTYPIEKKYFGIKVTIIRNIISFFIALIVALSIGLFYGELL